LPAIASDQAMVFLAEPPLSRASSLLQKRGVAEKRVCVGAAEGCEGGVSDKALSQPSAAPTGNRFSRASSAPAEVLRFPVGARLAREWVAAVRQANRVIVLRGQAPLPQQTAFPCGTKLARRLFSKVFKQHRLPFRRGEDAVTAVAHVGDYDQALVDSFGVAFLQVLEVVLAPRKAVRPLGFGGA